MLIPDPYPLWLQEWWACAHFTGTRVPDVDERIKTLKDLWKRDIGNDWWRAEDAQLLKERYRRSDVAKPNPGEHTIEWEILVAPLDTLQCLGGRVLDGINAVPLAKDTSGTSKRENNVEADMFLLAKIQGELKILVTEVKNESNNAWYAVVENLLQLRLAWESVRAVEWLFPARAKALMLTHTFPVLPLPLVGVVLAPEKFYSGQGQKPGSLPAARKLIESFAADGVQTQLAIWDREKRTIEPLDKN